MVFLNEDCNLRFFQDGGVFLAKQFRHLLFGQVGDFDAVVNVQQFNRPLLRYLDLGLQARFVRDDDAQDIPRPDAVIAGAFGTRLHNGTSRRGATGCRLWLLRPNGQRA